MCPIGGFRRRFSVVTRLRRAGPSAGPCISGLFPGVSGQPAPRSLAWRAPPARTTTHQGRKLVIRTFDVYNRQSLDRWRAGQVASCSGRPRRDVFAGPLSGSAQRACDRAGTRERAVVLDERSGRRADRPTLAAASALSLFGTFILTVVILSRLATAMNVAIWHT
jgi:hypothetical protein